MPKVFSSLDEALDFLGGPVVSSQRVFGGDINQAFALDLKNKTRIFMKMNGNAKIDFFMAEAAGLFAISSLEKIAVPKVLALGTNEKTQKPFSFLILEFVQSISSYKSEKNYWQKFGRSLASLHLADASDFVPHSKFGFFCDNFIGQTPQKNSAKNSWKDFFCENRLLFQIELASKYFDDSLIKKIDSFICNAKKILIEPEHPSLLHGDLWSGNAMRSANGLPVLIDPAVYVGAAEADIAMTELFGGFPRDFYDSYWSAFPKTQGYEERRDIYNLYHILNHLNLFGVPYFSRAKEIILHYC